MAYEILTVFSYFVMLLSGAHANAPRLIGVMKLFSNVECELELDSFPWDLNCLRLLFFHR